MTEQANTHSILDIFQVNKMDVKGKSNDMIVYDSINQVDNLSEISNADLKYARDNVTNIIEIGQSALSQLLHIAEQSQQASAYEVLSTLMKSVLAANKDLVEIHQKNRILNSNETGKPKVEKTVNNLFVGSTSEMTTMLDQIRNNKK